MSRMLVVSIIFAGCLGCGLDTRGVGPARCDWERMAVAAPAPARYYHSLTRAQDDALWLFGGTPGDDKEPFGSLYRLGDGVWIAGPDGPPPREKHAAAYHRQSAQLLVFGGLGFDLLDDTWTFDGAKWVDVSSPGPSPRKQAAAAYHPDSEMVVLFGGQGAGDVFLSDTWLWDGTSWHEAKPTIVPHMRHRHLMALDERDGRVLLYGGCAIGRCDPFDDTWAWTGADWQLLSAGGEGGLIGDAMVYDSDEQSIFRFAKRQNHRWTGDAWESMGGSYPDDGDFSAAYDPAHGGTVVFGGLFAFGGVDKTWIYRCAAED